MEKKQLSKLWMAWDIECAQSLSEIVGIGATLMGYDPITKKTETIEQLLIPLFQKHTIYYSDGSNRDVVIIKTDDGFQYAPLVDFKKIGYLKSKESEFKMDLDINGSIFDKRTWEEFWVGQDQIPALMDHLSIKPDDPHFNKSLSERYKHAAEEIRKIRTDWELLAKINGLKLITVTDTASYDLGSLEHCIMHSAFNYSANVENDFIGMPKCTHSMQEGIVMTVDPVWYARKKNRKIENTSFTVHIRYLYDIPEKKGINHDHNPMNDSEYIANEYGDLWMIHLGIYQLNVDKVEK